MIRIDLRTALGGSGLAILLLARATSVEAAGPTAAAGFAATARTATHVSAAPLADVVACFGRTAKLPSFAHTARYPGAVIIRLRFDGLVFETVEFTATPAGGTRVSLALSGNYDARDRARFEAARGAPLAACLADDRVRIAAGASGNAL